jgi:hypothetical protein
MTTDDKSGLVKIVFRLDPGAWHGSATESLWAGPVSSNCYRLLNVPFYVFGVNYEDVIEAENTDGVLTFARVVTRSGHSTYRILLNKDSGERFGAFWAPLAEQGCTYEEGHPPLLAVDVPADADLHKVYELLEGGEAASVWSFEEGSVGRDGRDH